jgi:hypothetical protein
MLDYQLDFAVPSAFDGPLTEVALSGVHVISRYQIYHVG